MTHDEILTSFDNSQARIETANASIARSLRIVKVSLALCLISLAITIYVRYFA